MEGGGGWWGGGAVDYSVQRGMLGATLSVVQRSFQVTQKLTDAFVLNAGFLLTSCLEQHVP